MIEFCSYRVQEAPFQSSVHTHVASFASKTEFAGALLHALVASPRSIVPEDLPTRLSRKLTLRSQEPLSLSCDGLTHPQLPK